MKVREPYKCDHCGIQRAGDANHWWLIWSGSTPNGHPQIRLEPWHKTRAAYRGMQHACGVDCMMKLAAQLAAEVLATRHSPLTTDPSPSVPLPNSTETEKNL